MDLQVGLEGCTDSGQMYLNLRQGKRRKAKKGAGEAGTGLIPGRLDLGRRRWTRSR